MTREEELARLTSMNHALEALWFKPLFSEDTVEAMSANGVHEAVRLTEERLLRVTKGMVER